IEVDRMTSVEFRTIPKKIDQFRFAIVSPEGKYINFNGKPWSFSVVLSTGAGGMEGSENRVHL
ncbi:MAG: hypothetical protein AAFO91_07550, partial [Bacteroidota bacterium]